MSKKNYIYIYMIEYFFIKYMIPILIILFFIFLAIIIFFPSLALIINSFLLIFLLYMLNFNVRKMFEFPLIIFTIFEIILLSVFFFSGKKAES